jgi:galactoside O-acetyltransferase
MIISNVVLGENVEIDKTADFNNVHLGDNVRIRKYASVFGAPTYPTTIGKDTKINMLCTINGYDAPLQIGERCGIGQNSTIVTGSGPRSPRMRKAFPIVKGPVKIGNDCWIGADCIIVQNVTLGDFCIVAANSFVNKSFPPYSIIGGNPAKLIRMFTEEEIIKVNEED